MGDVTSSTNPSTAVVWFRSDLRLGDNPAWAAATSGHDRVVALFVLDQRLLAGGGDQRQALFLAHLGALDRRLGELGAALVIREADTDRPVVDAAVAAVADVVAEAGAGSLYLNADVGPLAQRRDEAVAGALGTMDPGVQVHTWWGRTVHRPGTVLTGKLTLSKVFTPFHKQWERTALDDWPDPGDAEIVTLGGSAPPDPDIEPCMEAGEHAALDRLADWLSSVDDYGDTRNLPAVSGTSRLSADLRFGTISAAAHHCRGRRSHRRPSRFRAATGVEGLVHPHDVGAPRNGPLADSLRVRLDRVAERPG